MALWDFLAFLPWRNTPSPTKTDPLSAKLLPDGNQPNTEIGTRSTDDARLRAIYQRMQPNFDLYAKIRDIRYMDQIDGHVKRIHHKTSHSLTKGGLILKNPSNHRKLAKVWREYYEGLGLENRQKLASDARGLMMEGNLPIQFVLDKAQTKVIRAIRMPAETIRALVDESGQINDNSKAYAQYDWLSGRDLAYFARWQLDVARLDPLNFDDMGEAGRPFLDASRKIHRQLLMTLDDLVIRRRERAPMRTVHILEGADEIVLTNYKKRVEQEQKDGSTNFYVNKKGGVDAIQGDTNLDQIADVALLLDGFFSGTPAPKGLFGYTEGLNRDILEDMKKEFYDELDVLQDVQSWVYAQGFRLHLLLNDLNPDALDWDIQFGERMTETLNQRADRALKVQSLGASRHTVLSVAGLDAAAEKEQLKQEALEEDPYPVQVLPQPVSSSKVSITPSNARKGESATSISHG